MASVTLPNEEYEPRERVFGRDLTNIQSKESLDAKRLAQVGRPKSRNRPKTPLYNVNTTGGNGIAASNKENLTEQQQQQMLVQQQQQQQQRRRNNSIQQASNEQQQQATPQQHSYQSLAHAEAELKRIEEEDRRNPELVSNYQAQIFEYMRSIESRFKVSAHYMERQGDINQEMRTILIDWLVQVHLKFKLLSETLFMTVSLIDRFLDKERVTRDQLQLVGVAALFIASKYEEIYPPHTRDFVDVADRTYTKEELFQMEGKIIQVLDFEITNPSPLRFLDRYCRVLQIKDTTKQYQLCRYLLELALTDMRYLQYSASNLACSAIYLSQKIFRSEVCWNDTIAYHARYTEKQVRICSRDMCLQLQDIGKCQQEAVRKKFLAKKYQEIAAIQIDKVKRD